MIGCLPPILGGYKFFPSATAAKVGAREEKAKGHTEMKQQGSCKECSTNVWAAAPLLGRVGPQAGKAQCLSLVGFRDYLGNFWVNETQIRQI
jgi:hypothetical protein